MRKAENLPSKTGEFCTATGFEKNEAIFHNFPDVLVGSLVLGRKCLNFQLAVVHLTRFGHSTTSTENFYTIFFLFDSVTSPHSENMTLGQC